jgi:serine/threonine-protein kinase
MGDAEPTAPPIHTRGRYRLLRRIGRGGMGEVWQAAIDNAHGVRSLFALKVLHAEVLERKDHRAMLVDEARIASRIQSPNTARVIELLDDELGLCIVMEWIDGVPLSRVLADGPLPLGVALRIAADVCAGLHAAHELVADDGTPLDVVHRDVSPQNLIVDVAGVTKVVDFGIAKARGRLAKETTSGVKGKASYMSLEQARATAVDRRADVFAVGVVLYEMLTGENPFGAHDDLAALVALNARAAPNPLPPDVPAAVGAIVRRALNHDAGKRFPTALAMKAEIEAALVDCNVPTDHADVARAVAPRPTVAKHRSLPPSNEAPPPRLAAARPAPAPSEPPPAPSPRPARAPRAWLVVVALVFGVGLVLAYVAGHRTAAVPVPTTAAPSVTVAVAASTATTEPLDFDLEAPVTTAPAASSVRAAPPTATVRVAPRPSAAASTELPSCDPPWYIDSSGHRAYWKHCLRHP